MKGTKKQDGKIILEMDEHDFNILHSVFSRLQYINDSTGRNVNLAMPFPTVCDRIVLDVKKDIEEFYHFIKD